MTQPLFTCKIPKGPSLHFQEMCCNVSVGRTKQFGGCRKSLGSIFVFHTANLIRNMLLSTSFSGREFSGHISSDKQDCREQNSYVSEKLIWDIG